MPLVYAAGQIGDKSANEQDLTGQAAAGCCSLISVEDVKEIVW
jgi:hypothetical protein